MKKEKDINYGISLFKVIAMMMVVMLHIHGHGGILVKSVGTKYYYLSWFIELLCIGAVNCFALTSGYLLVNKTISLKKILNLWMQVIFYSFGVAFLSNILFENVSIAGFYKFLFPVTTQQYWYFSAYFITFLLIPILNKIISDFNQKRVKLFLIIFFVLFSASTLLPKHYGFSLGQGYSWMWLAYLYLIGAYYKKYSFENKFITKFPFLVFVLMTVTSWAYLVFAKPRFGDNIATLDVLNYCSPFTVVGTVALLVFFSKLNIRNVFRNIVVSLGNLSFGVYLLHEHALIRDNLIVGHFSNYIGNGVFRYLGLILITMLIIFSVGILAEYIRVQIFKYCKINDFIDKISQKLTKMLNL